MPWLGPKPRWLLNRSSLLYWFSKVLTFSPQVLNKDQEAGSSTTTIQPDKEKDKPNELSWSRCSKGTWRRAVQVSGAGFFFWLMNKKLDRHSGEPTLSKSTFRWLKLSRYLYLLALFESGGKSFRNRNNQFIVYIFPNEFIAKAFQRPGSYLSLSLLLLWPTHSS